MLDYLVRFAQVHESFRIAELQAIAELYKIKIEVVHYSEYSPFAIIRLPSGGDFTRILSRAILIQTGYELWGSGLTYEELHESVRSNAAAEIPKYLDASFKFSLDSFHGCRNPSVQRQFIDSFAWLGFRGPISLKNPDQSFVIFEEFRNPDLFTKDVRDAVRSGTLRFEPEKLYFGRLLGSTARDLINKYSLKKRQYLSTTSMDAELALVMANIAHAKPGSLFIDPFIGTGSLTVACAHFGSYVLGSDIDPRSLRGKDGLNLKTNYKQYHSNGRDLGSVISDLVNTPFRGWDSPTKPGHGMHQCEWIDGIICDPPYGVREGLKTLGRRNDPDKIIHYSHDGFASHLSPNYIAPRKPYSFVAILADLLSFAAAVLVPNGRLSFWMPTADDVEETLDIPMHGKLELVSVCVQPFNKWSRRLITYRKRHPESCCSSPVILAAGKVEETSTNGIENMHSIESTATTAKTQADDLNPFRKRYFQGFRTAAEQSDKSETPNPRISHTEHVSKQAAE